jgi:hypothetical protein
MTELSQFQKFAMVLVHRSELRNAPYNPRVLDDDKRERLQENLQRVGLVEPVIWNRRTGNLVGGHQRLAALDALQGQDYHLQVAQVSLTDKEEREQNVFLNNPAAQGQFEMHALKDLFGRTDVTFDTERAGFDQKAVQAMFPEPKLDAVFERAPTPAPADPAPIAAPPSVAGPAPQEQPTSIVVFLTREDREHFMELMGHDPDERYIDGIRVLAKLGLS